MRSSGEAGQRWLDELPGVVDALARQWKLEVGRSYSGGTAGVILETIDDQGCPGVLKIAMALDDEGREAFTRSVHALRLAEGRGCVRLRSVDASAAAVVLERLGPNLAELGLSVPAILDAVCSALALLWRPAEPAGLRSGPDQVAWLADFIPATWDALGRPCERSLVDRALALCGRRADAFSPSRAVLAHGDAHGWNTVAVGDGTYRLVDPEGLWAEPEHDLSVLMREYNGPLLEGDTSTLVRARAAHLAARCEVDADAVWEWGFIERVATGLASMRQLGDVDGGRQFLAVAARSR